MFSFIEGLVSLGLGVAGKGFRVWVFRDNLHPKP